MIYLDHHTTTYPCNSCIEKMQDFQENKWSSSHASHLDSTYDLETCYQMIYDFLGASYEDTFAFFSSWSEAVSQILFEIYLNVIRKEGKTHIIAFNVEKTPILPVLNRLKEMGVILHLLDISKDGIIDLQELKAAMNPRTALVCCSWANGFTGVIQPMESIVEICKEYNVQTYVDATYLLGKVHIPLSDLSIDYLTFSGAILHGPHSSSGALIKKEHEFCSLHQTLDLSSLMGLASACQQSLLFIDQMGLEVARLRHFFEKKLTELQGMVVYGQYQPRLSNVSCIAFDKVNNEALLFLLQKDQLYAALADEACFLSFSLSRYTTKEEIEKAIQLIVKNVQHLQKLSEDL